ncbi:hypothetical protein [Micromonospora citrea]|uniref:hypothetical protein n=1 Tax=Micromonospora citrea TaxID=47855 RepID=UPI000B87293A|nr:hypothetical protein [Micromonospora citrea]
MLDNHSSRLTTRKDTRTGDRATADTVDTSYWVMTLCYAPLLLWGPLLAVVTFAYYRRRRHETR